MHKPAPTSKKDLFGSTRLDELTEPLRAGRPDTLVAISARIRFSTFEKLKRALHHLGGIEQEFIDAALNAALDALPESTQPLPPARQAALEKRLRR